jgi:hypothetical protein
MAGNDWGILLVPCCQSKSDDGWHKLPINGNEWQAIAWKFFRCIADNPNRRMTGINCHKLAMNDRQSLGKSFEVMMADPKRKIDGINWQLMPRNAHLEFRLTCKSESWQLMPINAN